MSKPKARIYRFKVSLLGIEPEIWRLIEVPETYTFWDLHVTLQDAMGWLDYHLHAFEPATLGGSNTRRIGIPESPMDDEFVAGWTVPIARHFANPGDAVRYDYDFGDGWPHEVRFVAIEPRERGAKYPRCIGHDEMVEWLKGHAKNYFPYRPAEFDASAVRFWDPKKRWKMMMGHET